MKAEIESLEVNGHAVISDVFCKAELDVIVALIEGAKPAQPEPSQGRELYAIRRLLQTIPALRSLVLIPALMEIVALFGPEGTFLTKSIYFDKPAASNWFVALHQDISISVKERVAAAGFGQWTQKEGIIGVVPPVGILENTLTVRIHLDETDGNNGGLQVVPGSHRWGIVRKETLDRAALHVVTPRVPAGGVMLMRPLTLHASRRSALGGRRRVIHLEFCNQALPQNLEWAEQA